MRGAVAVLVLVAVAAASAAVEASESALSTTGRRLLQTSADCSRSVPYCNACRYQLYKGTVTKAICTSCQSGYVVKSSGRACWCAPGFAFNSSTGSCDRCGMGNYCPGSASTQTSAVRFPCGANKLTTTEYARSAVECVILPGYGWAPGDSSPQCPAGFYNPGYNTRSCSRCPGGLTTPAAGSTSTQDCVAPAGYYWQRGSALPCAQGTYKATVGNRNCDQCPTGFTTQFGSVAATNAGACSFVVPGFNASKADSLSKSVAQPCPANTYRSGAAPYSLDGVPCTPCKQGLATTPGVQAATTENACLVPPGLGWRSATGDAVTCAVGSYNEGWNRAACKSCDSDRGAITTSSPGSITSDQCIVPAGYGSTRSVSGGYTGFACPADTYGRPTATTGLVEVTCVKCMEGTTTNGKTGSITVDACVTNPGYGYYDGQVLQCDFGSYSPGGDQSECADCGDGYNTTADGSVPSTIGVVGATSASQCAIAAGWAYTDVSDPSQGLAPCSRGFYKDLIGNATCSQCPSGTTTTIVSGAVAVSDCNACSPGYGNPSGFITSLKAPSCSMCPSGTYSPGYFSGGQFCAACPKPSLFSGKMVSLPGISTPENCLPEFPTDGNEASYLPWDVIPMPARYLTGQPSVKARADCQVACASNPACQYFVWYDYTGGVDPQSTDQCFLRVGPQAIAPLNFSSSGVVNAIGFEARQGVYAVYAAVDSQDAASIGTTLRVGDAANIRAFCDATSACIGVSVGSDPKVWRAFGALRWEGAFGKIRLVGESLYQAGNWA